MSYTFTLSGVSNPLHTYFFPPVELKGESEIALLSIEAPYAPLYINSTNNTIFTEGLIKILIPTGFYTFEELGSYLNVQMKKHPRVFTDDHKKTLKNEMFSLDYDAKKKRVVVMTCWEIKCQDPLNTFFRYLGFTTCIKSHTRNIGDEIFFNKYKINCIGVTSSYFNNSSSSCIYELYPEDKYNVTHQANSLIYYKISDKSTLNDIVIDIRDRDNNLVDFQNQIVTIKLHLRQCR